MTIEYLQKSSQQQLPVLWNITAGQTSTTDIIATWIKTRRNSINAILNTQGALLIRGLENLREACDFEQVITAVFPQLMDYVGGTSPRHKVKGKILEATYVPPSWSIPLHQEMAYTIQPPERIAFFCQKAAEEGGESTIGDMRRVLPRISPDLRDKCQRLGLVLRRTLPSPQTQHLKPGVKKTWHEVFDTTDPIEASAIIKQKGWRVDWLNDGAMHLWQDLLPATRKHPVDGQEVWCNQAHFFSPICMMDWAKRDGREEDYQQLAEAKANRPEMLDMTFYGNGEPVSDGESREIARVIESLEVPLKLQTSDLLILDNLFVAHGRYAFQGKRDILVALINMPEMRTHEEITLLETTDTASTYSI